MAYVFRCMAEDPYFQKSDFSTNGKLFAKYLPLNQKSNCFITKYGSNQALWRNESARNIALTESLRLNWFVYNPNRKFIFKLIFINESALIFSATTGLWRYSRYGWKSVSYITIDVFILAWHSAWNLFLVALACVTFR